MKKIKLLLAAMTAMVSLGVNATDWTGSAVAEGTYYLYNVGAGQFLSYGKNWGTRAVSDEVGIPVTLEGSGSVFKIKTCVTGNSGNVYLGVDFYIDQAACDYTFAEVEGHPNVYTMCFDDNGTPKYRMIVNDAVTYDKVQSIAAGGTWKLENLYWMLISKDERDAAFAAGTPGDITYKYIENYSTAWFTNCFSTNNPWQGTALGGFNGRDAGNSYRDRNTEHYSKTYDTYIQANDVPDGKYRFSMSGYYRDGYGPAAIANYKAGTSVLNAKIYANKNTTEIQSIGVGMRTAVAWQNANESSAEVEGVTYYVPNGQDVATFYFNEGLYPFQHVETMVTDGTLRFGMKKDVTIGGDWTVFDKFRLEFVEPAITAIAVALPLDGAMAADTWYYFDIPMDGDYTITADNLENIVQTNVGNTILQSDESSVTGTFNSQESLTAGRYCVKSSSDQTFTVAAQSLGYTVGSASSSTSGQYLQSLASVSFDFAEAATTDQSATFALLNNSAVATLKKGDATVTTGALSLSGKVLTATFSDVTLDMASSYSIEVPADVVGYAGEAQNEAFAIYFYTPAVADGIYYMKNTYTNNYLSRQGNYNTQARMDEWGLAIKVSTDASNNTQLQYFDSKLWLGDDGFCYADCTGDRIRYYNVSKVEGGYKFLNTSNSKYLAVYEEQAVGDAVEGGNLVGTSNIWTLESTSEHVANYTANANTQAAAAATAAGLSCDTKAGLDAELENNYNATNITITGKKEEKFQVYPGQNSDSGPVTYYTETVENLKPGLYKLSVDAFQRAADFGRVFEADGARSIIYLYAGDAKTQLKSVTEYGSPSSYDGTDYVNNGLYYANRQDPAYSALETGNYTNEVYVYVADAGEGTGSLEIGIKNPTRLGGDYATWCVYNNWKLTYYDQTEANMTVKVANKYATFVAPFDVTIPAEVDNVYTVEGANDGVLDLHDVTTTIPANTPVVVFSESGINETFYGKEVSGDHATDWMAGVYEATQAPVGSYVLQNQNGKVGFYKVAEGEQPTVPANRAYLTVPPQQGSVKAFFFDKETGINGVLNEIAAGNIFDLSGRKVAKMQKGQTYIVGDKKVNVK